MASGTNVTNAYKLRAKTHTRDSDGLEVEDSNVQIKNIYGIPSEQEKLQIKATKLAKQKKQKLDNMKKELHNSFESFSKDLKESDFDRAMRIREQLSEMTESSGQVEKVKINAVDFFKKGFAFPEVAKNDFSGEVLDELEIAEKNLNSNLENVDLFNNFVDTAEKCKKKLKDKYQDQWTDPLEGNAEAIAQINDEDEWILNHYLSNLGLINY